MASSPRSARPLEGLTVVVTRPRPQAGDLSSRLRERGAEVLEAPTIRIVDPPDRAPLHGAARKLRTYDWVVFTSVNGVQKFRHALEEVAQRPGSESRFLEGMRVAAIGPATAEAARRLGADRPIVPDRFRAEALVRAIVEAAQPGQRVLIPRAAEARSVLPDGLRAAGAEVDEVEAYVTLPDPEASEALRRRLDAGAVDWITFTSSSTVRSYVRLVGGDARSARIAAIGPITASTARKLGLSVAVVADEYTIPGLVAALEAAVVAGGGAG